MPSTMRMTPWKLQSPIHPSCNPFSLTSSQLQSRLLLLQYNRNSSGLITHHRHAKHRTIRLSSFIFNQLGFSRSHINFRNLNISHTITSQAQAESKQSKLYYVGNKAFSITSLFLFIFLVQQTQLPISSAITQILNSDFQSNLETNMDSKGPQTKPRLDVESTNVIDIAKIFSPDKATQLGKELQSLQDKSDWKIRVLTRLGPSPSPSDKAFRDLWQPDERTVIIVEDISSPNILNFGTGLAVGSKLPRQFFIELQSRYGNQFFVSEKGYQTALLNTIDAIKQCIDKEGGCKNVPGLTDDLYFLTLATSISGGAVFGFAARLSPQGRVDGSWQWIILLSPLWILLFGSFGILPVIVRTSDLEPILKNSLGFLGAAIAFYLTPLFGKSPIEKSQ